MNLVENSDEQLIKRAISGDRVSFSALVTRHYDRVFSIAWKWCGNREDAEDITQDVFVRLGKTIRSFSGSASFSTWLYRVVVNATHDHHRKKASDKRKMRDLASEAEIEPAVQEWDGGDDPTIALWVAVRALPQKQCDAVMLVYGEGLSHKEAADALNCSPGTIASNIHDAKKQLRGTLNPPLEAEESK